MNKAKLFSISTFLSISLVWAAIQPVKATLAPVIDGELDDACWQNAPFHSEFYAFNATRESPLKTEFAIACTETDIVFAFRCLDTPTTEDALADRTSKGIFKECVEIMLDPTGGKDTYFHFAIGRNGALYDRRCEQGGYIGDATWESNFTAKVKLQENSWTCEAAIPYRSLELRDGGAENWSINVTRESKELASIAKGGAFNVAAAFLKMKAPEVNLKPYSWEIAPVAHKLSLEANIYTFILNGEIINHTGQDGNVLITSTLIGPGNVTAFSANPAPHAKRGEAFKYETPTMRGGECGQYTVITQIRDADNGRILSERRDAITAQYVPVSIKIVSPSYRNAIFATQKLENVVFDVVVNLNAQERKGATIQAGIRLEDGTILVHKNVVADGGKASFTFPNSSLPEGKLTVFAELTSKENKPLGKAAEILRKLPYMKNEVFRGDDGNWYIDGKKRFLLLGWNSTHAFQTEYLAAMPAGPGNMDMSPMGFGLISSGFKPRYLKEGWTDYVTDFFTKRTQTYMKNENLFAHYWLDEPDCMGWSREFATRVAKLIAEVDPWHPVVISSGTQGVTAYPDSGELNGFHCYPSPRVGKPMANFSKIVVCLDKYNREKANWEKPQDIVYLHQGFNYGDVGNLNTRVPSYEEYRNQNILALAMGCTGILHYNRVGVPYPELTIGMAELIKEQKIVGEHAIIQTPISIQSPVPELKLRACRNEDDGSLWILAVYAKDGEYTAEIPVTQNGEWQVLSENRAITVNGNTLKDHFTPFQAHIYTTDRTDYKLKTIQEIVKLIDDEYEARRKPGNLAYQRLENQVMTVTASSNKYCKKSSAGKDTALWHVTDGIIESPFPDLDEQCFSDSTPNQAPDWIELSFHKPISAGKVVVYPKKESLREYEVQVSQDGQNWTTVGKVENATGTSQTVTFDKQTLKHIRIFVTKTNGPHAIISEIEVYEQ